MWKLVGWKVGQLLPLLGVVEAMLLLFSVLLLVPQVDKILKVVPRERVTFLYSATMTSKVQKLQRAALKNPVRVEVSSK